MNEDIIVLYDENGNEENYEHIDTIEFEGEQYVVLTPALMDGEEEGDDLVKVVYICSNIAIAEQNLTKLRITNELKVDNAGYSIRAYPSAHAG